MRRWYVLDEKYFWESNYENASGQQCIRRVVKRAEAIRLLSALITDPYSDEGALVFAILPVYYASQQDDYRYEECAKVLNEKRDVIRKIFPRYLANRIASDTGKWNLHYIRSACADMLEAIDFDRCKIPYDHNRGDYGGFFLVDGQDVAAVLIEYINERLNKIVGKTKLHRDYYETARGSPGVVCASHVYSAYYSHYFLDTVGREYTKQDGDAWTVIRSCPDDSGYKWNVLDATKGMEK